VATIGPASQNKETLRQMIKAGATTFRLNFSHGDHDYHRHSINLIRQLAFELNQPIGILQDLFSSMMVKSKCGWNQWIA